MRVSYRGVMIALYLGSLIPLLVLTGLVVYAIQQTYMLNSARDRLVEFVRADVNSISVTSDTLPRLAIALNEDLRILGADVFLRDAQGLPVPPALGTGPWMSLEEHQTVRESGLGVIKRIATGQGDRLVYLTPILDAGNQPLGSIEASISLDFIENELASLRQVLAVIIAGAAMLASLLSVLIAEFARRPLRGLLHTADQVARGDLSSRAPLTSVSEIAELSTTFNTMLDRIQSALNAEKQLTEEMRRFAADASHELRSPLSVFRSSTDVLDKALQRGDTDQAPKILALLRGEINNMTHLVDNLLFLARLEADAGPQRREVTLHALEPLPLLEEVYERAQMLASGQDLLLQWPQQTIPTILGDRDKLRRALNNLVENAIHHTPPGKQIVLGLEIQAGRCIFRVADQGSGIPAEDLPRIFERFYRGDTARTRGRPGTGLGLAIVRAIAQAHGGQISVHSQVGQGTLFTLSIPATRPPIDQD